MITSILSLRYYDLKRISDEERQAAFDTGKSSDSIEESSKSSDLRQPLSLEPVDGRASSTDNRRQHGGVLHTEEDLSRKYFSDCSRVFKMFQLLAVNRNKVDIADGLVSQVRLGKYPNSTCHFELEVTSVAQLMYPSCNMFEVSRCFRRKIFDNYWRVLGLASKQENLLSSDGSVVCPR